MVTTQHLNHVTDFDRFVKMIDGGLACRFVSLLYRASGTGELARHTILLNVKREKCLEKDLEILNKLRPTLSGVDLQACDELIKSIQASLSGDNPEYTKKGYYSNHGERANVVVGAQGQVAIRGYTVRKEVIEPGEYKSVKSAPKTIAKNKLRKQLRNTKIREFVVKPETFLSARHNGNTISIDATRPKSNLPALSKVDPVVIVDKSKVPA